MHRFPEEVVAAVLRHMNDDHSDDGLVIVRGNGAPDATSARMTAIDGDAGTWVVRTPEGERDLRVEWSGPITERAQIRQEIVRLHEDALVR